jgi:hypothetical protein
MAAWRGLGAVLAAAAAAVAMVPASAAFARGPGASQPGQPLPNYDVREQAAQGAVSTSSARTGTPQPSRATTAARAQLADDLGDQAVVQTDPVNGTLRTIQRLNGTLTGAGGGSAQDRAWSYVTDHATAIGLDSADLATFSPQPPLLGTGGLVVERFAQSVDGIPTLDNVLKVGVDGDGRVLNVTGSPNADLTGAGTTPAISATDAVVAALANTAVHRTPTVRSGPSGPRQTTTFDHRDRAELVLFGDVGVTRLAWRVLVHAPEAIYDVVVDASNGDVLRRASLTDAVDNSATVFPAWPGRPPATVDLTPYLTESEVADNGLAGPNVWAWADLTDVNYPFDSGGSPLPNQIVHRDPTNAWKFPTTRSTSNPTYCGDDSKWCTWDGSSRPTTNWMTNLKPAVVNMFWLVNMFHEHLAGDPGIDFHDFEGDADRIWANGLDGASTGPDLDHLDNANMSTLPAGQGATMQMYLATTIGGYKQRDVDYDFDPLTIWHEYTHGLSNRLITDAGGYGALDAQQSGAMGEGWSDWYALDAAVDPPAGYPISDGPIIDDTGAAGDVNLGAYTDPVPGMTRTESIDCPVGSSGAWCAGTADAGHSGGYTYADYGKVIGQPEVHADGEIWAQTLWDLRGAAPDVETARDLVTNGMRLTTPNPSFLDARNGILAAAAGNSALQATIWQVFARRGMGFYAGAASGGDNTPVADFSLPPSGGADGTVTGTVTDADTGAAVTGATAAFGGHEAAAGGTSAFVDDTDATGGFAMTIPAGSYPKLTFTAPGYDTVTLASAVAVSADGTTVRNQAIRRDWASLGGGSAIVTAESAPIDTCGPQFAIDADRATGWSASTAGAATTRTLVFTLPTAVDIAQLGFDPTEVCGDDDTAAAGHVRISTSTGGAYTVALDTTFTADDRNALNLRTPTAGATGVTKVKIELLSSQNGASGGSGADWIDMRELEVYGAPTSSGGPAAPIATTLHPDGVTSTGAALHGVVNAGGDATTYRFEYGTSAGYGEQTAEASAGSGTSAQAEDVALNGLTPSTTYHYRVVATNSHGTTPGADRTFTTAAPPPPPTGGGGGGGGTATTPATPPSTEPTPTPPAVSVTPTSPSVPRATEPSIAPPPASGRNGAVSVHAACTGRCTITVTFTGDRTVRRLLGVRGTRLARSVLRTTAGQHRLKVSLTRAQRQRLRKAGKHRITLRVTVHVREADGDTATRSRRVTVRI